MKKVIRAIILFSSVCFLLAGSSFAEQGNYPQLDISGFKKWEYKKAEVSPSSKYFSGLSQLGGFYPTFTGGPWQERLRLQIFGKLSENLSATYDLEQQPETPERYNVKVKYYETELSFGDISANFSGNEFAATSKSLNGVMLTSKDSWYDLALVPSSKVKSYTQKLTAQKGNNTKGPYNLGHSSIIEGTERIELNGVVLTRNINYTIDYFGGKITFNSILTTLDEFKYSYEYTNIIDLFFPSLSKRDFFGFQSRFTIDPEQFGKPAPLPEPVTSLGRNTFPTTGELEPEISEEEDSGQYRVKNTPLVKFSERLTFMGSHLKKDEDYIIRYNQGEIKLLTRFLPTEEDPLIVEYKYYQTSKESEVISGIDSRGPYNLSYSNVVPESEKIQVDEKFYVRNLDYSINYDTGEMIFGIIISSTSQIKAQYQYNIMELPAASVSKFPKELKIGTTYLKETAKAGTVATSSTVIESLSGQDIIDENYHIYLQSRPVVPTAESSYYLSLKVDGTILTAEVDYALPLMVLDPATGYYSPTPEAALGYLNDRTDPSDGYDTGTIKFINTNIIHATSEVVVAYAYYKSIIGKYSGSGDGNRGPYYLQNVRNLVPGSETVQVWEQGSSSITTYTRNASFEADAGDTGYSINYQADNPYILFNNELTTTKNFQIIYQYKPPSGFTSQDLNQSVLGLDSSFKIGEIFKFETALAKSEIDRYIAREPTSESFAGNGSKKYTLHSAQEIIEGSEKIYINNLLLNKDADYFFSYSKPGQLTFYYISPSTQDAIQVDYDFQSISKAGGQITTKSGNAYRLGAETKLLEEALIISGTAKKVGHDFVPLGGASLAQGSEYLEYNVKYQPAFHSFFTNYSYKENHNPIGSYDNKYLRTVDNSISSGINPGGVAKIDLSYRNYRSLDDILPASSSHGSDNLQDSYALSLVPKELKRGVLSFTQKYELKRTFSEQDVKRDSSNFSESTINYQHVNGNLKLGTRLTLGYDYQLSEPKTNALNSSSVEAISTHSRAIDTSQNISLDLTMGALEKWTARVSLLTHSGKTLIKNFAATNEADTTKNETYHMDFIPFRILKTSLDHNRQERQSYITGGTNPKSERTTANVGLTPLSWLSTNWSGSRSEAIPQTGITNKTSARNNTYNINYNPISLARIKLTSRFSLADNNQVGPSGTTEVTTDTNTFSQNYTLNLVPHPIAPVTLGYTLENYKNENNHLITASRINTETQNQTINAGLSLSPTPILSLSTDYNLRTIKIIKDLNLSPSEKLKTVFNNKISYQVTSWGTLIYDRQDEKNGGEIQAGAVTSLNIEKTTQTYSLNISIPVENPVLSNFVFSASVKSVDYKNLDNASDNFTASLASFEGTLNF